MISERGRVFRAGRGQREIIAKDTVSDVGSVDEFYVVDDSDVTTPSKGLFGSRSPGS